MGECWYHLKHKKHVPAVAYWRHECPVCKKLEIVAVCAHCDNELRQFPSSWTCDCGDHYFTRERVGDV